MRLKSIIWVKAYLRRCAAAGATAVVVRHGDDDAGAIYVKLNTCDGRAALFSPAPASLREDEPAEHRWTTHLDGAATAESAVDVYLARQTAFDPDLWIVEVEDRMGRHGFSPHELGSTDGT